MSQLSLSAGLPHSLAFLPSESCFLAASPPGLEGTFIYKQECATPSCNTLEQELQKKK